ncbi:hypothetical protein ACCO45_005945 [Purpureocillium lilacinum]|uniref:Uncharacterized protein n=1 Tax=Purpureocillium lilacinum TaxID=33203 RepID=A0ACC4DXS9_PURLI
MHAKLILCAYMLVRAVDAAAVATNATDMTLHERAIVESGLTQGEATRRSQRYNSREVIRGYHCAISMMKPVFVDPNSRRHGWATQETTAYYPCPEDSPCRDDNGGRYCELSGCNGNERITCGMRL